MLSFQKRSYVFFLVVVLCVLAVCFLFFAFMYFDSASEPELPTRSVFKYVPKGPVLTFYKDAYSYVGVEFSDDEFKRMNIYRALTESGPWELVSSSVPIELRVYQDYAYSRAAGPVFYRLTGLTADGAESEASPSANIVIEK